MARHTWKERIEAYLAAHGYSQVATRSAKYTHWQHHTDDTSHYFIGKHGAARLSRDSTISHSFNVSISMQRAVIRWEQLQQEAVAIDPIDIETGF